MSASRRPADVKEASFLDGVGSEDLRAFLKLVSTISTHRLALLDEVLCPDDVKKTKSVIDWREALDLWRRLCNPTADGLEVFMTFKNNAAELSPSDVRAFRYLLSLGTPDSADESGTAEPLTRRMSEQLLEVVPIAPRVPTHRPRLDPVVGTETETDRSANRKRGRDEEAPTTAGRRDAAERERGTRHPRVDRFISKVGDSKPPALPIDPEHPQRVSDCTIDKTVRRMGTAGGRGGADGGCRFYADTKYDGERLIAFRNQAGPDGKGQSWRFFSRNMLDVPERKLANVREALDRAFPSKGCGILIDAEILSLHTFGSMNRVKKVDLVGAHPIRIYVFDVVWFNGHDMFLESLDVRRELLQAILKVQPNLVEHSETTLIQGNPTDAATELQRCFDGVMAEKLEGLVVKPAASPYTFGGTHWVKLKRDYLPTSGGTTADRTFAGTTTTRFVVKNVPKGPAALAMGPPTATTGPLDRPTLKLRDTLDAVIVACLEDGRKVVGLLVEPNSIVPIGVVHDSRKLIRTIPTSKEGPELKIVWAPDDPSHTSVPKKCTHISHPMGSGRSLPVVEITASGIIEVDARITSSFSCCIASALEELKWTLSADANIIRVRDDKNCLQATKLSAFKALILEATTRTALSFDAAVDFGNKNTLDVDYEGAEEDEAPLSSSEVDRCVVFTPKPPCQVLSALLTSAKPPVGAAIFLLVPVARERMWSDRGLMGEVTATLGPKPKNHCDSTLARKTCIPGSIAISEVTWGEGAPFRCAVIAFAALQFGSAGSPQLSELETRTALRRIRNVCMQILRGATGPTKNGISSLELHGAPIFGSAAEKNASLARDEATYVRLLRDVLLGPILQEQKESRAALPVVLHLHRVATAK